MVVVGHWVICIGQSTVFGLCLKNKVALTIVSASHKCILIKNAKNVKSQILPPTHKIPTISKLSNAKSFDTQLLWTVIYNSSL